ncbi:hypothetical protein LTS15_005350 [Exophiala xenobiotica]|nr:hypothetical protein LTS15_005350 [Exophiala xenobiotica]
MSAPEVQSEQSVSPKKDTSASPCNSVSQLKSSYIQSRIARAKSNEDALSKKLAHAKQEAETLQQHVTELETVQATATAAHSQREQHLNTTSEKLLAAIEKYHRQCEDNDELQQAISQRAEVIASIRASLGRLEARIGRIEKEAQELEKARSRAMRQAEILDLDATEIEDLAMHALSNQAFADKIARVRDGTGTAAMKRAIKSDLWDTVTGMVPKEFSGLMERILHGLDDCAGDDSSGESETLDHRDNDPDWEEAGRKKLSIKSVRKAGSSEKGGDSDANEEASDLQHAKNNKPVRRLRSGPKPLVIEATESGGNKRKRIEDDCAEEVRVQPRRRKVVMVDARP